MDRVKHTVPTWRFRLILVILGLADVIFLVYLGWWFAASVSVTFWPA
jgi:hypothetical protein